MERRLLFGMAGVVMAVLFALAAQVMADARDCGRAFCGPGIKAASDGGRS